MIYLDTNAVIRLFSGNLTCSEKSKKLIEDNPCYISPLVKLELQYLYEVGRGNETAEMVIKTLHREIGLEIRDFSLETLVKEAVKLSWTRDPFDRLITAQAKAENQILLTSDWSIQKYYNKAIW